MGKYPADPNAPKRPATGYFLFMAETRASVVAANPSFQIAEIGKAIGNAWSSLAEGKKKVYQDRAASAKAKYDAANEKYKSTPGYSKWLEGKVAHKKAQKASDKRKELKAMLPNKPKRPLSGYMLFAAKYRSTFEGSAAEVAAKIGQQWGQASGSEKEGFQRQYEAAKTAYDNQMAKFVQTAEYKTYEVAFNKHQTDMHKIRYHGSVANANRVERTRLAARAKKQKEQKQKARERKRKQAIRA